MATDTPNQAATIPIPTTEPELPLVPLDESALNPEYDPAKDQRAPFLKIPSQTTGLTISPAPKPSLVERAKKVVTEGIPRYSTRTSANPKYEQEQLLAPEEAMTPEEQRQVPVAAGALEAAGGLTSPATVGTVAATAGLGEAGVIPKVLSGLFAGQIAASVYDQYPALKDAVNRAQTAKTKAEHDDAFADAQRILTHMGADTVMGLLAAKHGAEGAKEILDSTTGSGVPDQASTFKAPKVEPTPAPEETHPEMNRDTVKKLQNLGYSNQHITNFNIGEIRDILKNETPAAEHPVSKPTAPGAAPEPDKFAEEGGVLVNAPKAEVSATAETAPKTEAGATDPIEDFIMSDKVKGKVVRPATPKPTRPAQQGRRAGVGGVSRTLPEDSNFVATVRGDLGMPAEATSNNADMGSGGKAWLNTDGTFVPQNEMHRDGLENLAKGNIRIGNLERDGSVLFHTTDAPTEAQRTAIGKDIAKQGVIYDLTNKSGERVSGETQSPGEFWRTVDQFYAPKPEAFAEHGGKLVGKAPEPTAPAYHPDLQKVADQNGGTTDSAAELTRGASFITPDGKFIHLPAGQDHPAAIAKATGDKFQYGEDETEGPDSESLADVGQNTHDNRVDFINQTGAIRTRFKRDSPAGPTMHISVPASGVTADQIPAVQQTIAKAGRNGNVVLERADVTPETKDELTMTKEFPRAADTEDYLRQIQAHPDQQDLLSKELQTPHKETYRMEVTSQDGMSHKVDVDAHSPKQALATVQKQFPSAAEWRLDTMPEGKVPSPEYSVPTGKIQKMTASLGRPEIDTIRHELGHAFIGYKNGIEAKGMISSSHPVAPSTMRAGILWDRPDLYVPGTRNIKPEKLDGLVDIFMGGIAADEVFNDLPRAANHNFFIHSGGDGTQAYTALKSAGYTHAEALERMHKSVDNNLAYLKQPGVSSVLMENAPFREAGLSRQYHASPERLQSMHLEAQRRIANDEGARNNGAVNAGRTQNNPADVARGESEVSRAAGQTAGTDEEEEGIVSEEKIKKPHIVTPEEQSAIDDYNKEKDFAGEVLSGEKKVEDFPYYSGYQQTIDAESKLIPKGKTLFIGGGPVPLSSILLDRAGFSVDTLELDPATAKLGEHVARKSGMKDGKFIAGDARDFKKFGDYDNIVVALEAGPTDESKTSVLQNIIDQVKPGTKILARGTAGQGGEAFVDVNNSLPKSVGISQSVPTFEGYGQTHVLHSTDWHETAGKAAATDEAGGIDPRTGKSDTKGIGTEILPEMRQPLDHAPTATDFKNFYAQHQELFYKYPELRVGWDNNSAVEGGHEINIGAVSQDAARVAKKLDQKSAFDIAKGEVIPTGGTGLRTTFSNYPIEDRIKDIKGEPLSNIKDFEHLSQEVHDNLEPDERDYLKGEKTLQRNVMSQYHKIDPSVAETTNAMQAGAALGGWWKRYIDIFHNLADPEAEEIANTVGPSHAEVLKQWHAAVSGNKSVQDANNLAWHSYADWLDAGKPTDRESIDNIVRQNGAQPEGGGKKGNAAISDTRDKKGKLITPGLDTNKLFNLVNSPEMRGERPFNGDVFREDAKNPLMGSTEGARKIPSMGATVAGKGNLQRLVIDAHIRDFYGHTNTGGPAAQYIADSVHLRQAAKDLGLKGGEGQEQLWGTVLGLKTLLKEGLTPEAAGSKLDAKLINSIGKDYAEVIINDPEITGPGGVLDELESKYGIGRGSAGVSEAYRKTQSTSTSESQPAGSEKAVDTTLLAKTAERIRHQISESKIKKPAAVAEPSEEDTLFNFGANVKPVQARSRISKASPAEQAENAKKVAALIKAIGSKPGKK
jgi:Nicotianamine synthase protein